MLSDAFGKNAFINSRSEKIFVSPEGQAVKRLRLLSQTVWRQQKISVDTSDNLCRLIVCKLSLSLRDSRSKRLVGGISRESPWRDFLCSTRPRYKTISLSFMTLKMLVTIITRLPTLLCFAKSSDGQKTDSPSLRSTRIARK